MARHPPSHRRELIRLFKEGAPPLPLLKDATTIDEPGHAAVALLSIAGDERVPTDRALAALRQAGQNLEHLDRPARIQEAWSECLEILATWRPGELEADKVSFAKGIIRVLERLADGEWTRDVIVACAPHLPVEVQEAVMRRAMANRGFELPGSKAVWDHGDQDRLRPIVEADPEVAARLLARAGGHDDAIQAAWAIDDAAARIDALRVLVWQAENDETLRTLVGSTAGRDAADTAQVLTLVGAREDRLGIGQPALRFDAALAAIHEAPEAKRRKLLRKLEQARERAGLAPIGDAQQSAQPDADDAASDASPPASAGPQAASPDPAATDIPIHAGPRHVLALVDGYGGGLGNVHVRAVARAAPLCIAFDLDLCLIGFPTDDLDALVDLVEADTHIGEGAGHLGQLREGGRLTLLPLAEGLPATWPGHPVATTPHPEDSTPLEEVEAPLCLLVGLGRQGIPRRMLHAVPHHELTGQGISLETATAMGILADRLGRISIQANREAT